MADFDFYEQERIIRGEISPEEILEEREKLICPTCNGNKSLPRMSIHGQGTWVKCWRCNGTGDLNDLQNKQENYNTS